MPGLRKVPQVMVKNDRDETTALFPFPIFCLFSGSILSLSFSFFSFLFCFCFFYVTEGEKQGSGVDSVCGVIKQEMVAAR
jgi:sugar phosphate permease